MTQNQIAFYKAQEERRHNLRSETQTDTSISENIRHNKASESINWYSAETGAAVGFAQAAAAQAQAAAANKQASVAAQKVQYDYELGTTRNLNEYKGLLMNNQLNWAKQNEMERHNKKTEDYQGKGLVIQGVTGGIDSVANLANAYAKVRSSLPSPYRRVHPLLLP